MSVPTPSIIDTRRHQMFPSLAPAEIERLRRFGVLRAYGAGEALVRAGEVGQGLTVILAGEVEITQRNQLGRREPIVTYGPGAFIARGWRRRTRDCRPCRERGCASTAGIPVPQRPSAPEARS